MQEISYFNKMTDFVEFEPAVYDNDNNDDYNSEAEDTNISDIDDFIDDTNYDESVESLEMPLQM